VPHLATLIFLFFYNEPEFGVGINPGMVLTPIPSSIGQGSNLRPSGREQRQCFTARPQLSLSLLVVDELQRVVKHYLLTLGDLYID